MDFLILLDDLLNILAEMSVEVRQVKVSLSKNLNK
jgi:hypothetical protein